MDVEERQAQHVLMTKARSMTEEELEIKQTIEENRVIPKGSFCVVFTEREAVEMGFGEEARASKHYKSIRNGLQKLCSRTIEVELPVKNDPEKKVIMRLVFLEEKEGVLLTKGAGKKRFRAIFIPEAILYIHKKLGYGKAPAYIMPLLRKTPPDTILSEELLVVAYFIFSEVKYNKDKENILCRKKKLFIKALETDKKKQHRHTNRIEDLLENKYFPKLKNLGVIKEWSVYLNEEGEEVYKIVVAARKDFEYLFI